MKLHGLMKTDQMVAFVLFLAIGVFGYLLPAVGYFSSIPGDLGDARFNSVILEHLYRWVGGRDPSLWSPPFFYPFEHTLAFSENHFGSGAAYILFRWLGFAREGAFNGWFLVGGFLNYAVTYYVLRRLSFSGLASAAGAFVFAFSLPVLLNQDIHSQLLYRYAIPLAMLGLYRTIDTGRLFHLWQTFLWVAVQFFCSIYLGLFLVYLLVATILGALFFKWGRRWLTKIISSVHGESAPNRIIFVVVAAVSTLAVAWLLYRYQVISREYGFVARAPAEIATMLPRLGSYLLADHSALSSWVGNWVVNNSMRWEHQMFVGIGVLIVATYGALVTLVAKRNQIFGQLALISLCILFIVTLNIGGHSIYLMLIKVPGLGAIRAISRIIIVMLLPISILVAVGIDSIRSVRIFQNGKMMFVLTVGLAGLLGAETVSYKPYNEPVIAWRSRIDAMKKLIPQQLVDRPILFISRTYAEPFYSAELDGMILGQDLGMPTLNGYSGNVPPGYMDYADPCVPYISQLYAYADFRGLPKGHVADLMRRIVHLAPEPCKGDVVIGSNHLITAAQAKLIQVTVVGVDYLGGHFWIKINNNSTEDFNPLSSKGNVRLSWRFVPLNAEGVALNNPEWDTRKDLWFVIKSGESFSNMIDIDSQNPPGYYRLEVSMVQEAVAWLYDLGMPVGTAKVKIGT